MTTKPKFQAIRGTRDLLPPETALWNHVEETAHAVFGTFGFGEIRLPIFEPTELFARAVGGETDIVSKEMYTLEDRELRLLAGHRDALRYAKPILERGRTVISPQKMVEWRDLIENLTIHLQDAVDSGQLGGESAAILSEFQGLTQRAKDLHASGDSSPEEWLELSSRAHVEAGKIWTGDTFALRPEATASVCRAYIEHGMQQLPQPVKLYYMGPMFRRERQIAAVLSNWSGSAWRE